MLLSHWPIRGVIQWLKISGNLYNKSEISYVFAPTLYDIGSVVFGRNPFEKREISYAFGRNPSEKREISYSFGRNHFEKMRYSSDFPLGQYHQLLLTPYSRMLFSNGHRKKVLTKTFPSYFHRWFPTIIVNYLKCSSRKP